MKASMRIILTCFIVVGILFSLSIAEDIRWNDGIVPIKFGKAFRTERAKAPITETLRDIEAKTCVRFISHMDEQDYVYFFRQKGNFGCYSQVGKQRGRTEVHLSTVCMDQDTIVHQVIHALGIYHEHSRSDRDEYVTIMWDNIPAGSWDNFKIENASNLDFPYDYNSVMHSGWNEFAIDSSKPTIVPKGNATLRGERVISAGDMQKINRLYGCCPDKRRINPLLPETCFHADRVVATSSRRLIDNLAVHSSGSNHSSFIFLLTLILTLVL